MATAPWMLPRTFRRDSQVFEGRSVGSTPFTVRGASGQTASIFNVEANSGTDYLTVAANGNVTIAQDLTVSGSTNITIDQAVTGNLTLTGNLTVNGNSTIGNAATDTLTVYAVSTFRNNLTIWNDLVVNNSIMAANGTAAAPSISFTSDTDTGIYRAAANQIGFAVNGSVELTLDATNLSPGANDGSALGVSGTAFSDLFLASGGFLDWNAGDVRITHSANALTITGGDTFISDVNGFVVGNSSQITQPFTTEMQILGTASEDSSLIVGNWSAGTGSPILYFLKSRDPVIFDGTYAIVQDNDPIGGLYFIPDDGVNLNTVSATFYAEVDDATPAAGDVGSAFVWQLQPGAAGVLREVLRISAAGNVQPGSNDLGSLGISGTAFADLFLASGGVINWSAANVTITHSTNAVNITANSVNLVDFTSTEIIFNNALADVDIRIEADNNANLAVFDAGSFSGTGAIALGGLGIASNIVVTVDTSVITTAIDGFARLMVGDNGIITTNAGATNVYNLRVQEINISIGTGTPTTSTSCYIENAATEATSNYALWVDVGKTRLDGGGTSSQVTAEGGVLAILASTVNGNNASSTIAVGAAVNIGVTTYTNDNANLTMTNSASLYIAGIPVASTNVIFTNAAYALWVDAGTSAFGGNLVPDTTDGAALGTSALMFSDLFLASGGVINWDNGAMTITHSTPDAITIGGGNVVITQPAQTTPLSPTALTVNGGAHTAMPQGVEAIDVNINLGRTVEFGTGALTAQRAMLLQAPTYAFVGASTLTTASTFVINRSPSAGANATFTNSYAAQIGGDATHGPTSASMTYGSIDIPAHTITVTGTTQVTSSPGVAGIRIGQITVSDGSAVTINNAASLYIANAPVGGGVGPAAITNPYAIWVDAGNVRIDDSLTDGTVTFALNTIYRSGGTDVALADGGTNASLTASNGGIFYSTASAGAILAGTATAGQLLQSGATAAPTWSTTTYPATNAINTLLYASSANVMAALATANGGVLNTSATGVPSITATPLLGVAGTTAGTLRLSGLTSGVVTIDVASVAGTWSFTLPTGNGTANYAMITDGSGNASWSILPVTGGGTGGTTSTGSGAVVLASGPTLTSPTLGDASGTTLLLGGSFVSSEKLAILGNDNGIGQIITINATSANVTGADTFIQFRATNGLLGDISGTGSDGVIAYNTFTGSHYSQSALINKSAKEVTDTEGNVVTIYESDLEIGTVLVSVDTLCTWEGEFNNNLPQCAVSSTAEDKAVYGVYGGHDREGDIRVLSIGSGIVKVCDEGGAIGVGDLLCTAGLAGYAKKYTGTDMAVVFAKARQSFIGTTGVIACSYYSG